jgi:serine/threonine-protein kinase
METKVADPLEGALLSGRYRITGRLARGQMATVYHAWDERLERAVAIKIIHSEYTADRRVLGRLDNEARTVARLAHPGIVAIFDQGVHEGAPYLVMEYVHGRSLREILADRRRLDPAESLAIMEQILAALAVAHRAGLVHRDVKPQNVLIAPPPNGSGDLMDAVVKLADFGLAHSVDERAHESTTGLPAEYVAPELVSQGRADQRSDVYSAGIVLFEMLTGRPPFEGDEPAEVAWQHVDNDVPAPSRMVPGVPPLLDQVVARATRREPSRRPRDAAALLAEVQAARDDVGALAGPTRALAHPTVAVSPVAAARSIGGGARPSWARLTNHDARPSWARVGSTGFNFQAIRDRITYLVSPQGRAATRGQLSGMAQNARGRPQLLAGLIIVVVLALVGGWWLGFGRYTTAPGLVQMTKTNAEAAATQQGFGVRVGAGRYSETVPINTVIDQNPEPGAGILRGGTVTLILSLGPERYPVPDVVGQDKDFAGIQLRNHFVVQLVNGYSDLMPVGYVVSLDPPAGTPLKPNSTVKVEVATGPFPVHVPDVVGKQLADAEATLSALGFDVTVQFQSSDPSKPAGQVLTQDPIAGQGLASASGVKVTITIASGPPLSMPTVLNLGCQDAVTLLTSKGLQVSVDGSDMEKQTGRVQTQSPNPGDSVTTGAQVQIVCRLF